MMERTTFRDYAFSPSVISLAYENLPGSKFLRFIVERELGVQNMHWLRFNYDTLPKRFYMDLACGWASGIKIKANEQSTWNSAKKFTPCTFHTRNDEVAKRK